MGPGAGLFGAEPEKRGRGRPKGSTGKRSKDLAGVMAALYGGTAALQIAKGCMVTPRELKAAGGDMAAAQVAKAVKLAQLARDAQAGLNDELEQLLVQAAHRLALGGKKVDRALDAIAERILARAEPLALAAALKLLEDARASLLPYTDQRMPQRVEVDAPGLPPPVAVFMGMPGGPDPQSLGQQGFGPPVLPGQARLVTAPKSPEGEEGLSA